MDGTPERPRASWPAAAAAGLVLGAAVLAALQLTRGLEYWDYSEGVYALSARLLARGGDLYGDVVAAQPPGMFVAGAGALAIHDSLGWLRLVLGVVQLATGMLAARAVWRLTASVPATIAAPAAALLTPWAVHQHGALTPELLGAPLLLGAALLLASPPAGPPGRARGWRVPAGAVLGALAPFLKWPFALPMVLVLLACPDRGRALRWALPALAAEAALSVAAFGTGVFDDTVLAQLHVGRRGLGDLAGVWGQAGWSVAGLLAPAAVALALRARSLDEPLARVLAALAIGFLLTVATAAKLGTSLNILVPVEATLVPLALAGIVLAWRARPGLGRVAVLAAAAGLAFVAVQTTSLIASPRRTASPFIYPTSERGAWGRVASDAQVNALAAAARRCPPGVPYGGAPLIALVADRPVPAGQPDGYLTTHSSKLAGVAAQIAADRPVCP